VGLRRAGLGSIRGVVLRREKGGRSSLRFDTQYILTLIDSDMPRDADGNKISFANDEIILRLHDEGNEGRLFKMAEF
jgi:uncharacterized protein YydD (DUF2326 family)